MIINTLERVGNCRKLSETDLSTLSEKVGTLRGPTTRQGPTTRLLLAKKGTIEMAALGKAFETLLAQAARAERKVAKWTAELKRLESDLLRAIEERHSGR